MGEQNKSISRRLFLSGTAATIAGASVLGASEPIRAASDPTGDEQWTQPDGNAASTAANRDGVGPTGDSSIAWEGGISGYHGDLSVGAVVDGTVYPSGSVLGAFDATDGTEQWTYRATPPKKEFPESSVVSDIETPTVMDGTVFAPVRFGVFDGDNAVHTAIIAVDAATGTKRWRIDAPISDEFSSVTAVDGSLFVSGPDLDGGEGQFVYALDPADGTVRWRQPRTRNTSEYYSPVAAEGLVFVSGESGVKAYDAANGKLVWEALSRVKDLSVAMVSEGTLFVSESTKPGATIIALEATSGSEQWRTAYSGNIGVGLFTADTERLYISTSEDDADVIALDRADGSENWRRTIPQPPKDGGSREMIPVTGMARVGKLLYVGGAGLKPSDGSIVWTQGIEDPWIAGYVLDAVAGGRMYFGGDSLIVMDGTETQTETTLTVQPDNTNQQKDTSDQTETTQPPQSDGREQQDTNDRTETTQSTTPDGSAQRTDGTTPQTDHDRTDTPSGTETTAADGPGFGILAAVAGVCGGAWRYRTSE